MDLSIQYSGKLLAPDKIEMVIEHVQVICEVLEWKNWVVENEKVRGICFGPAKSDPIVLTFSSTGELVTEAGETTISAVTDGAGWSLHKAILKILNHLKHQCFDTFDLTDTGGYWQTPAFSLLKEGQGKYGKV
jgi:hypothetical protein